MIGRRMLVATLGGLVALLLLWSFMSYLQPAFTGEVANLLRCN